jgi:mycothiol synthase
MMEADLLPPGYTFRPPTMADAEGTAAVMIACGEDIDAEEVLDDWQQIDLAEQAVIVVAPSGRIVASGDILNRRYVRVSMYGFVHPEEQGRGLGRFLVRWAEEWVRTRLDRAPAGVQVVLEFYANRTHQAAERLLQAAGYPLVRTVYVMEMALDREPPEPEWPEGLQVRSFRVGQDEQALYEAGEEAFADTWSRPPGTLEGWLAAMKSESFDPTLWFLAEEGSAGKVAGLCRAVVVGRGGWILTLAVRRPWRGRGLGLALLRHAFGELYRRKVPSVGLSVDAESPTGAPRLYKRAGMSVTRSYGIYRRELRPGADFTSALHG